MSMSGGAEHLLRSCPGRWLPCAGPGANFPGPMGFRETLLRVMDGKNHWAWAHFSGPAATRRQLLVHYQQEFLTYVRDFPVFLGRLHGRCPDPFARRLLAENLYEEETGALSGTAPHPDLFLQMMGGLGFDSRRFASATPIAASKRYRDWLDRATTRLPWVAGAAVITIFVEGSVHERRALDSHRAPQEPFDPSREPLVVHHGLDPKFLTLKRAHSMVENGHRAAAWSVVERHARGATIRSEVEKAMKTSLRLWHAYRDGVAAAAGLERSLPVR